MTFLELDEMGRGTWMQFTDWRQLSKTDVKKQQPEFGKHPEQECTFIDQTTKDKIFAM